MIKIRVEVTTPKGQATNTEKKLRWFIIGKQKTRPRTYVNKIDNRFYWDLDVTPKKYNQILKNLSLYDSMVKGIMNNNFFKKQVRGRLSEEDEKELSDMLLKQTKIKLLKTSEANQVIDEKSKETFWQTIKNKFKRID